MSTDLITKDSFLSLQEGSEIAEAMEANLVPGEGITISDLPRVSIPAGGKTTWTWEDRRGEQSAKEISGVLVLVQPYGVLWPTEDVGDNRPLLVTTDLIHAYRVGREFGDIDPDELEKYRLDERSYNWQDLPWNQWGSGRNGTGKRCKEQRLLFVLAPGEVMPYLVTAQPGSLKAVSKFIKQLDVPFWRAIVKLTLKQETNDAGISYASILPVQIGVLDKTTGDRVKALYTDPLRQSVRRIESVVDKADDTPF